MEEQSTGSAGSSGTGGGAGVQEVPVSGGGGGVTRPSDNGIVHSMHRGGGHILEHVEVHLIFWGHEWKGGAANLIGPIRAAVESILTGPYLAGLAEYGVGSGSLQGSTVVGEPGDHEPQAGFDSSLGGPLGPFVSNLITAGRVPPANAAPSMLYCIVMPPGLLCARDVNGTQLLGEHAFVNHNGQAVLWAFISARNPPTIGQNLVDDYSWIFSHEVAEACTDPLGNTFQIEPVNPVQWNEIGDVCQSTSARINGVLVQLVWSDKNKKCFAQTTMPAPRWDSLNGVVQGGMAVASNANGCLELFVRGTDDRVYRRFQVKPNGGWNDQFEPLDGKIGGQILALGNHDGRLALFARNQNGVLAHSFQLAADQDNWSAWTALDPATAAVQIEDPIVGIANQDGRLALFARRNDGVVLHRSQQEPGKDWTAWEPLDEGVHVTGALAVARNGDGRLELFGCDAQGVVHHVWQNAPGGTWTTWASLGGSVRNLMAVGRNQDGRLEVFIQAHDQEVQHRWQLHAGNSKDWSPNWVALGHKVNDVLVVATNHGGQLEAFGRAEGNALWHVRQQAPNGGWQEWASLGGNISDLLAVGTNADGRLEVFARSEHLDVRHTWQVAPGGPWITQG